MVCYNMHILLITVNIFLLFLYVFYHERHSFLIMLIIKIEYHAILVLI